MLMAAVMIGVDPHKASRTAVVISAAEEPLGELRVRACAGQAGKLVAWAASWPERTWAVEGAGGLGRLLAQQLVAAGERVLDVPPEPASRVRLLQAGDTDKNDPDDALPVAVAALRSRAGRQVAAEDYPAVLKVWSKRHRDLARARNQVACRLHAVLCDLVPGGLPKEISAAQAAKILEEAPPSGAVALAAPGSPPSSWPACAAWMPSCVTPARSWPPRSGPAAPPSPRSSAPAPSSPVP
jgi:transposase